MQDKNTEINKKIYLAEDWTERNMTEYKIVTWAMNKYKGFDKQHVCADMGLFHF